MAGKQKRLKPVLASFLVIASLCLTLGGCHAKPKLVGHWRVTTPLGGPWSEYSGATTYDFEANGVQRQTDTYQNKKLGQLTSVTSGHWTGDDKEVTLTYESLHATPDGSRWATLVEHRPLGHPDKFELVWSSDDHVTFQLPSGQIAMEMVRQ